ncbi:AmmeMemoRadiSam system protein B [Candidatus Uhrbacteria bacterium]|nr:AmmeMemoRadiSam system protein B [Candidatus Uhrbacteria bacterium]
MIVFAAITPHSPVLMPAIGKENRAQLRQTLESFVILQSALERAAPDVLFVISPHGHILEKSFPLGCLPEYHAHFEQFGDFGTRVSFAGDVLLPTQLKQALEAELPLTFISEAHVDHGIAVPLTMLFSGTLHPPIVPCGISLATYTDHAYFGERLRPLLDASERRIAIIASADLSHRLGPEAPLGESPHGVTFDTYVCDLIESGKLSQCVSIDNALARVAGSCGIEPIAAFSGILGDRAQHARLLSYESPFGIGYATAIVEL